MEESRKERGTKRGVVSPDGHQRIILETDYETP